MKDEGIDELKRALEHWLDETSLEKATDSFYAKAEERSAHEYS